MFKIKRKPTGAPKEQTRIAMMHHQSGNLHQAETIYRKILKEQPDNFDALHMLGVLYAQQKNRESAVRFIKKALKINPNSSYAYYNLANVLRDNNRFDEASSYYQKIMDLHRNDNSVSDDLGFTLPDNINMSNAIKSHQNKSDKSILISVPVFNRKRVTRLSLAQIKRYKTPSCFLQVYNDHSDEYDNTFLTPYADEVIRLPDKKGINALRWHQFRCFLESDFDFIYMTDSDVIHDPEFISALDVLYETGNRKLPVCLFNSAFHMEPRIILYRKNGVMLKGTAPGVSMFYDRTMVERILSMLKRHHDNEVWDFAAVKYLGLPWITPETSYLEHYGTGGIHNIDNERDRAINPTEYLREKREPILKYLMHDDESRIDL
jgi:tetratricopeptide (TPR) repeat protein